MDLKPLKVADIANQVRDLLNLPPPKHPRMDPSHKAVRAVLVTIAKALRRGESVHIRGFGMFKVIETKPRKRWISYRYSNVVADPSTTPIQRILIDEPARKVVRFIPADQLRRIVNAGNDN